MHTDKYKLAMLCVLCDCTPEEVLVRCSQMGLTPIELYDAVMGV